MDAMIEEAQISDEIQDKPVNDQKILIADDIDYNIDALKIILEYSLNLDVPKVCVQAYNGQ